MLPRSPKTAWDSSPSSSEDESNPVTSVPPVQLQTFHTLQSISALRSKIEEQQQKERTEEREERKRQRETEVSSQDPNSLLVKTAFNLGVEAGRKQRDPPKPCETCENRKKKNRDAARLARELARRRADIGGIKGPHDAHDDDSD
jgi:hypothetical protein